MQYKNLTNRIIKHRHVRALLALLGIDIIYFIAVDPRSAAAVWLFGGFCLLAATITIAILSLRALVPATQLQVRRASLYGAALIVTLIGLQSIGQLTPRDVLTLLPFAAGVFWYIGYNKRQKADMAAP